MYREKFEKNNFFDRKFIAKKAAEFMYFNGIKDYSTAKKLVVKQLNRSNMALPSNEEIEEEKDMLVKLYNGYTNTEAFTGVLQNCVLDFMLHMYNFSPYLFGDLCVSHVSSEPHIEVVIFGDSLSEVIEQIDLCYSIKSIQKNVIYITVAQEEIQISINIVILPVKQKDQCLIENHLDIYQLAKKNHRLDDLYKAEETWNDLEVEEDGCFLMV